MIGQTAYGIRCIEVKSMERMPTIKIVYVPHTLCSDTAQISNTLSAAEAKNAVIDYILKRLILKPTE